LQPDELRLVHVIPYLGYGGLERVGTLLALALQRDVERLVVCSVGGEPFESALLEAGVTVVRIPRPRARVGRLVRSATALARVLRRERPHVVHAHNPAAGAVAALARILALQPRLAIVTTYHGVPPDKFGRASRTLAFSSDVVVGVGSAVTSALRAAGVAEERSATIYNAVEAAPARGREEVRREFGAEDAELVVTVGRYMPEKNQALLLDALAILAPRRPRLRALVVGYGPLEDDLRNQVETLGLGAVCEITGERHDVYDLMGAADCFALSSDWEALPLVVIEAMTLGCPVVSTDLLGVRDLVTDGENGLLMPVGEPAALAAGIERVLDDPALAQRLSAAARDTVRERCSMKVMVSSYEELYARAVEARAHGRRANASPST
jgi:glycosyltransferase involved in cell wall biosynthesis